MNYCYLNGRYVSKVKTKISVEDRGFNFSDSVYELIQFRNNTLYNYSKHLTRLSKSLEEVSIANPFKNFNSLFLIIKYLIRMNKYNSGYIYIQISRGEAARNHLFPTNIKPNVVILLYPLRRDMDVSKGVAVKTGADIRWKKCNIKSTSLLANVLGKQFAKENGVYEIWQLNEKYEVTEGTTSNSFIVCNENIIYTHPKNEYILGGVTRDTVIEIAKVNGLKISETPFNLKHIEKCKEAFLTSTTVGVLPVTIINKRLVSDGDIGGITKHLMSLYNNHLTQQLNQI